MKNSINFISFTVCRTLLHVQLIITEILFYYYSYYSYYSYYYSYYYSKILFSILKSIFVLYVHTRTHLFHVFFLSCHDAIHGSAVSACKPLQPKIHIEPLPAVVLKVFLQKASCNNTIDDGGGGSSWLQSIILPPDCPLLTSLLPFQQDGVR